MLFFFFEERCLRFIQESKFNNNDFQQYVDNIYTAALKKHKTCSRLHFDYGNFQLYFKKNRVKAGIIFLLISVLIFFFFFFLSFALLSFFF
jgi:hypothetical protein